MFAACATTPSGTAPSNTFNDTATGFSITKPSEWHFISKEILKADRNTIRLDDAKQEKIAREYPDAPLVVFTYYPEPYPTLNPSVSVSRINMPKEGLPPALILSMSSQMAKKQYQDLVVVEMVREQEVNGIQGAYTQVKYTAPFADGQRFPTTLRMWMIPHGKIMFLVSMSGTPEGPDIFEGVYQDIINSIKIAR